MRTLKLLMAALISLCCKSYGPPLMNETSVKYLLKVSWKNNYHGKISHYWLLEEKTGDTLQDFERLELNGIQLQVTSLISPRYAQEYLFCCERKNIEAINSKNSQLLIDSLGEKYEQQYKKVYNNEVPKLNQKKALFFIKDTLNKKYEISIFKMEVQVCKCRAASNNPGSSYTGTVANISQIINYQNFTKEEKRQVKSSLGKVFANKMIQEALPSQ